MSDPMTTETAAMFMRQRDEARAQAEALAKTLGEIAQLAYATQWKEPAAVVKFGNRIFHIAEHPLRAYRESKVTHER